MRLKLMFFIMFAVVGTGALFAQRADFPQEAIEEGKEITLKGTLDSVDGETVLKVGSKVYRVVMMPRYISYKDGDKIEVTGYLNDMDLLPIQFKSGDLVIDIRPGRGQRGCYFGDDTDNKDGNRGRGRRNGR